MFERYTEHARRVIFFSRYEASQVGSPYIEPEHLLLGVLRERVSLGFALPGSLNLEQARRDFQADSAVRPKISVSVDLPLTPASKRVLTFGAEEAEWLNHEQIGTQHLLLGLLREPTPACTMLQKHGLELARLREQIAKGKHLAFAKAMDAITSLRENFARVAERLKPDIEPAAVYSVFPLDRGRDEE